jgi:hypothetical protein
LRVYQNYEHITSNDTNPLNPLYPPDLLSQISNANNAFDPVLPITNAQGCVAEVFSGQSAFDTIVENTSFDPLIPDSILISDNSITDRHEQFNQESLDPQDDFFFAEPALFDYSSDFFPLPVQMGHQLSLSKDASMGYPVDDFAKLDLWTVADSQTLRSSSESSLLLVATELDHPASFNQHDTSRVPIHPVTKHKCTRSKCPFTASTLKQLR